MCLWRDCLPSWAPVSSRQLTQDLTGKNSVHGRWADISRFFGLSIKFPLLVKALPSLGGLPDPRPLPRNHVWTRDPDLANQSIPIYSREGPVCLLWGSWWDRELLCLWPGLHLPPTLKEQEEACLRATKGGSPGEVARWARLLMHSSQAEADPHLHRGPAGSLLPRFWLRSSTDMHMWGVVRVISRQGSPSQQGRLWWHALTSSDRGAEGLRD